MGTRRMRYSFIPYAHNMEMFSESYTTQLVSEPDPSQQGGSGSLSSIWESLPCQRSRMVCRYQSICLRFRTSLPD